MNRELDKNSSRIVYKSRSAEMDILEVSVVRPNDDDDDDDDSWQKSRVKFSPQRASTAGVRAPSSTIYKQDGK